MLCGALGSALLMLLTAASRSWLVFAVAIALFGSATSLIGTALNALAGSIAHVRVADLDAGHALDMEAPGQLAVLALPFLTGGA